MKAIENVGLKVAEDSNGNSCEKLAPFLNEPVHVWKNDSFIAAFPSPKACLSYGINFPQVTLLMHSCLSLILEAEWIFILCGGFRFLLLAANGFLLLHWTILGMLEKLPLHELFVYLKRLAIKSFKSVTIQSFLLLL